MATRFYAHAFWLPREEFDFDAAWEITDDAVRVRMFPYRNQFGGGLDHVTTETSATALDLLLAQLVSPPLQAQTISGTFAGVFMAREQTTGVDARSQVVVRVVAPDGTVRGTLVAASTAGLSNEWIASPSIRSARFPVGSSGFTVTDVDAEAGDRIVVELGARAHNTLTDSRSVTLRVGNGAGTDLPQNDTTTTNTFNDPWVEFSQTLLFQPDTEELSDSIAGAPDLLPASLAETNARSIDFDTFTTEADDPDEMGDFVGSPISASGWVKLDNSAGTVPAQIEMRFTMGVGVGPAFFIYDDVPVAASEATDAAFPNPFDFTTNTPVEFTVPIGATWYVGAVPLLVDQGGGWIETHLEMIFTRTDAGAPVGDIENYIADALDRFPSAEGTELLSSTSNFAAFTGTETDDPLEIADYAGELASYIGWLRLDVPEEALVSISIDPTTPDIPLMFWLYDETPTSNSVAVEFSDDDEPVNFSEWPRFSEITLVAGTYYLAIAADELGAWDGFPAGAVSVLVRWEVAPTVFDFDFDAVIKRSWAPPIEPSPDAIEYIGTEAAADLSHELGVAVPTGTLEGHVLIAAVSHHIDGDEFRYATAPSGWFKHPTLLLGSHAHTLDVFWTRYEAAMGSTLTFASWDSDGLAISLTKAIAVMAFSGISGVTGAVEWLASVQESTPRTEPVFTPGYALPDTDPEAHERVVILGIWAGGSTGVRDWEPEAAPPIDFASGQPEDAYDQIAEVSATSLASVTAAVWRDTWRIISARSMTPDAAEFTLAAILRLHAPSTSFALNAFIKPGATFALDSWIIPAIQQTRHPRTGPHFGVTPDTAIELSNPLGTLSEGATLQQALRELDDLISQRERGD